jgi:dTDP-4-amino-4,6-dideoxygalactose transaminase
MSSPTFPGRVEEEVPLSRAVVTPEHEAAALRALRSGWWILGRECTLFEEELARFFGTAHAVLCANGTAAITLALQAIGVKPGDEVIVPSLTAFPTAEGVINAGARPVYAEVDALGGIDVEHVRSLVGARTVGIIPVHLYGQPVELAPLLELARARGLFVLEDTCQAHGALVGPKRAGSFGLAAALSFYPSKNLTVFGDGGAVLTGDAEIARKVRLLRDHGRRDRYVHEVVGSNNRFGDVQAALGRVSLAGLEAGNEARRRLAAKYRALLAGSAVEPLASREGTTPVNHLFVVKVADRERVAQDLKKAGIQTGVHYPVPCHLQPAVASAGPHAPLPRTERLCGEILSLPMYPSLEPVTLERVVAALRAATGSGPQSQ